MSVDEHRKAAPREALAIAVLTVSDSRTVETDTGGRTIADLVALAGHRVSRRALVRDEAAAIVAAVRAALASAEVDALVSTGGTGFSPRDVTVDVVAPLFSRTIDGFGELFRGLSFAEIGPAAMLSRSAAGIIGGKPVFLLPGSPAAVRLAMEKLILPELPHLVGQLRR